MKRRSFLTAMGIISGAALLNNTRLSFADTLDHIKLSKSLGSDESFWDFVREQFLFPADYSYLNTGGIGAVPAIVMHEVKKSMNESQIYPRPSHDHERWEELKENCTSLLNSRCVKEELALTNSATQGINIVLQGLRLKKDDEIITSSHEHVAVNGPLMNLHRLDGVGIKIFQPDTESGQGNVERIKKLITKKTKLIFISHATCTTGQLFPIKEIGELAKERNILFALDGAQALGYIPKPLEDVHIDFYAACGHKWILAPKRTGFLYVRQDLFDILEPVIVGAYSTDDYDLEKLTIKLNDTAQRYEYGTQNDALFHGFDKAVDFIKTIGIEKVHEHGRGLAERFYSGLKMIPKVKILSPAEKEYRSLMISFQIEGKDFRKIGSHLTEMGLRVRVVPEGGVNGVRVSFHVYNNEKEVDRVLQEIEKYSKTKDE